MTMLVECAIEDFSDPEAVSGSSTNQKLVVFCCLFFKKRILVLGREE